MATTKHYRDEQTAMQRLLDLKLAGGLELLVREMRGYGAGWARISAVVSQRSGMYVGPDTLKRWFADEGTAA